MAFTSLLLPIFAFFPGYFLLKFLWRKENPLTPLEGILLSIGLSFFLSYPLGILNNAWEWGDSPFQFHLDSFSLISSSLTGLFFWLGRKNPPPFNLPIRLPKPTWLLPFISLFLVAFLAREYGLPLQSINGDEQEISLYAYHLVDGMFVGRDALFISTSSHSPLGFTVSFLIYQWLAPYGTETLSEALLRAPMLIFGLLELLVFILFAQRLKFSKSATLLGLLLVALHPFMILGSRLMIPQDGSVFAFFLLLFLYFFWTFLEGPTPLSPPRRFLLSLLFASILLVKLSGILLLPLIAIYSLLKKRHFKEFMSCTAWSLLFFSPVIFFNMVAYSQTGYMDVPFSKIANLFGIPANSIMANPSTTGSMYTSELPNLFQSALIFLGLLMDQWGFLFFAAVLLSIAVLVFKLRSKNSPSKSFFSLTLGLFLVSLIFFTVNGSRAYYAEFLTLPATLLLILAASQFKSHKVFLSMAYLGILFNLVSLSLATHWKVHDPASTLLATPKEYGRDPYTWEELKAPLSLASWAFLNDDGFPALQSAIEEASAKENQLLVIDDYLFEKNLHQFRWYLGLHRDIEAYYLGENYTEPYDYVPLSEFSNEPPEADAKTLFIYPYEVENLPCEGEPVSNHNGLPKFLVCE